MSKLSILKDVALLNDEVKLSEIQKILETTNEVKLEQMKLEDGVTTIEAEMFEAGQPVMIVTEDEQMIPLPVGDYNLEDGRILVVAEEGVIAEIKEAATEEEQPMEEEAPVAASEKPTEQPVKSVIETVSKETKFSVEELQSQVEELTKQIAELASQEVKEVKEEVELSAKPIVHNPENVQKVVMNKFASKRKESTLDRVMNKIANKK